jgi:23S rRNA (cytidine1920-2'-O)/16S rRNA (cytidine1409-2'-O)-methyltransferase
MSRKRGNCLRRLGDELARSHPELSDPEASIREGRVAVDGRPNLNPRSRIRAGARIELVEPARLRGELKLTAALETFAVAVAGRVALDAGASTGGFTRTLLAFGARRVYAVDAGHGQLLGSLRQDPRVVNLEATNLGDLDPRIVPDEIELISLDISYLALADAVPQLERLWLAETADIVALVKPQFELRLARSPANERDARRALHLAAAAIERCGWKVAEMIESPIRGAHGTLEFFVHGRRTRGRA